MTREDLNRLSARCCTETANAHRESIFAEIRESFPADADGANFSTKDAIVQSTVLALSLAPRIAAASVVQMLIELGLVTPDD